MKAMTALWEVSRRSEPAMSTKRDDGRVVDDDALQDALYEFERQFGGVYEPQPADHGYEWDCPDCQEGYRAVETGDGRGHCPQCGREPQVADVIYDSRRGVMPSNLGDSDE